MTDDLTPIGAGDSLDRELRAAARAARDADAARVSDAETDAALVDVTSGTQVARLRPVRPPERPRRWMLTGVAAAAAVVLLAAGVIWLGNRGDERIRSAPGTTGATIPATVSTTTQPSTGPTTTTSVPAVAPPPISSPGSTPVPGETTTSTTTTSAPTTTTQPPAIDLETALAGLAWEYSGIDRACDGATGDCTHVVFDPSGAPVSYDPATRTITRHMRYDGVLPSFVVPGALGAVSLLAAGPDGVVYLGVPSDDPEASDIVALTLTGGDAGREVARFEGALGLGDYDVVETPEGLASVGWYGQGLQPTEPVNMLAEWVDRSGAQVPISGPVVQVDFYSHHVTIGDRTWAVGDLPVEGILPAMPRIVPTLDGGFIARWDGTQQDLRSVVVRGWADGSVERWVVPGNWTETGSALVEPTGNVLVPGGEWFVRVDPFEHPSGWDGRIETDLGAWTATAPGLDEYLDANDPYWETESDPVAFAAALFTPDVASIHSIELLQSSPDSSSVLQIRTERLLDDSTYGQHVMLRVDRTGEGLRLGSTSITQTCQPDRGHQDYRAELCT